LRKGEIECGLSLTLCPGGIGRSPWREGEKRKRKPFATGCVLPPTCWHPPGKKAEDLIKKRGKRGKRARSFCIRKGGGD